MMSMYQKFDNNNNNHEENVNNVDEFYKMFLPQNRLMMLMMPLMR